MSLVVILNAPPGSGKDTLGEMLAAKVGYQTIQNKDALLKVALAASGIHHADWQRRYDDRELKETPWELLGGLTQREFLIRVSEEWMKPTFGDTVFGDRMVPHVQYILDNGDVAVFTDGGFVGETRKYIKSFPGRVLLLRLHRDGYDFSNDSRDYIMLDDECACIDINLIDGKPELALKEIEYIINSLQACGGLR